jgi:AsmA family protein
MARTATIRKYLLGVAVIVLASFLLLVIASWIWMATLDLQAQRVRVETLASKVLARDVHIDGPLSLSASLFPRVSIANVRIANPEWATQRDFLVVKQLEVEINPWTLLRREFDIRDIEMTGATVYLQRGPDQDATWHFKSGTKRESSPGVIPDIVALHAKDVRIMYYAPDRPPLGISIDELQASLVRDQPVTINTKGKIRDVPLSIELQGGTLAELLDPGKRWPLKGTLDTDVQSLDFEGYVTDTSTLDGLELTISSDLQKQRNPLFLGRNTAPLFDRYRLNLSVHKDPETYVAKLSGELIGFDLSRVYEKSQRQKKPVLKIQTLKINAQSSGKSLSEIVQSFAIDATGSGIVYQHPVNDPVKKFYSARIDSLRAKSSGGSKFELSARGTANDIPMQLSASSKNVLYALWQHQDVPIDMDIQTQAASAHFSGAVLEPFKRITLDGQVSVKADSLAAIGILAGKEWPGSAALDTTGVISFSDRTLTLSGIQGQLGTQAIDGEFMMTFDNGINLSLKAHTARFDLHDVTQQGRVPDNLVFGLNDLNLSIQGQGDTFRQSVLDGAWQVTAASGRVGWQSKVQEKERESEGKDEYVYALHDIRFNTHEQEPVTLVAQGLHNEVQFKLDAQAGLLGELLDDTQPYPLDLHVTAKGLSGSFQGAIQKPLADTASAGDLKLEGRLPVIGKLIHAQLAREQSADLQGHLAMTRGDVKLTGVVARTDGIVVNGELIYQAEKSPKLTIDSSDSSIDLAQYMEKKAKPDQSIANKRSRDERIVPDVALDFSKQRSLDAVVTIKDLNIKYKDAPITLINARLTARDGVFRLDPLETRSSIDASNSLAKIEIDSSGEPTTGRLELQADKFNFGEIIKRLRISNEVTGTMNLQVKVDGKGKSLRELMGSAKGQVQVIADKGSIPKWVLEIWGGALLRLIIPTTWTEDPVTDLNCAVARFDVVDGVMRSQTLLADTKRVTVAGEAIVNWQNEQINALFKPQPKDATLFHLGTPIQLSGTLAHPKVGSAQSGIVSLGKLAIGLTSPTAMIVMFGDVGAKEKNPCAALLERPAH